MDPRSTPFLSTFDDPPENPLREGGNWAKAEDDADPTDLDMLKSGGVASDTAHPTQLSGFIGRSYWTPSTYKGLVEVWGLPVGGQLGAALETWRLFMLEDPVSFARGYLVYIGGGLSKATVIRRYDDPATSTDLVSEGDSYCRALLLRINGDVIEAWASIGDPTNPANWVMRCSVTDTRYRGAFYIGMAIEDPTNGGLGWTAFGGGVRNRVQIYRWFPSLD